MQKYIREQWIRIAAVVLAVLIFTGMLIYANSDRQSYYAYLYSKMSYEKAEVLEVLYDNTEADESLEGILIGTMHLKVRILTGEYKGEVAEVSNYFTKQYNIHAGEGDKLSVRIDMEADGAYTVSVYNSYNKIPLLALIALFILALVLLGGRKGLRAVIGLSVTLASVVFLLIPLILKGWPVMLTTTGILILTTVVSFVLIGGLTAKSVTASLGCISGLAVAGILAIVFGNLTQTSGFQLDEAENLLLIVADSKLTIKGLFASGVLIAAQGAVMDISMSIASAQQEIRKADPKIGPAKLFRSGMNIGRDAMGTMANTLILAFAGASVSTIVLVYAHSISFDQLINTNFIAVEVIRGIAGSLGIVFTVPAVSFIGSRIIK